MVRLPPVQEYNVLVNTYARGGTFKFVLSDLLLFKHIVFKILRLPDSETVDVDPEGPQLRTGSQTDRVPDLRQPGRRYIQHSHGVI